jgi:putative transposase
MRGKKHTEEQIIAILKQTGNGLKTAEACRQQGISEQTLYRRKAKYGGMEGPATKTPRTTGTPSARAERENEMVGVEVDIDPARAEAEPPPASAAPLWVSRVDSSTRVIVTARRMIAARRSYSSGEVQFLPVLRRLSIEDIGMTPFAFRPNSKRAGRTRQGFAIRDRRLRAPLTEPALPQKSPYEEVKGRDYERISAVTSPTTSGPIEGEGHEGFACAGSNSTQRMTKRPVSSSKNAFG